MRRGKKKSEREIEVGERGGEKGAKERRDCRQTAEEREKSEGNRKRKEDRERVDKRDRQASKGYSLVATSEEEEARVEKRQRE